MSDIFENDIDDETLDIAALEDEEGSDSSYSKIMCSRTTCTNSSWCIQVRESMPQCPMTLLRKTDRG